MNYTIKYYQGDWYVFDSNGHQVGSVQGFSSDEEAEEFIDLLKAEEHKPKILPDSKTFKNGKKSKSSIQKLLSDEPAFTGVVYRIAKFGQYLDPRCWKNLSDAKASATSRDRADSTWFSYYKHTYHNGTLIKKETLS